MTGETGPTPGDTAAMGTGLLGGTILGGGGTMLAEGGVIAAEATNPVGWVLLGGTIIYFGWRALQSHNQQANDQAAPTPPAAVCNCPASDQSTPGDPAQPSDGGGSPPFVDVPGKIPFQGTPGSTVRGGKDSRTYGPDGFPQTDRNEPHESEAGIGNGDHSHDWGRPSDGSDPTHLDRGPPRLPQPGDPPPPRGFP